jgi:repressor LexA
MAARYQADMYEWAKRLQDATTRRGWTTAELARRADIDYDSLTKYMAGGVHQPRGDKLMKLARALGLSLAWLRDGEGARRQLVPPYAMGSKVPSVARRSARMGRPPRRGNIIRAIREARGMTQEQLAAAVGSNHSTIGRLETGRRRLTKEWMVRLARALNCDPSEFLADGATGLVSAPLIDWVAAGAPLEPADPYPVGGATTTLLVAHRRDSVIALRVVGDSIDRVVPEGGIVFVDYRDKNLVDRKFYVIRAGREATVKRYRAQPPRFEPFSSNPEHATIFGPSEVQIVGRVFRAQVDL